MNSDEIIKKLNLYFPNPVCELHYKRDYELLLSVMLSAQTTDKRVNMVTDELYKKYDSLEKLDNLTLKEIEEYIKPIGMYKTKAKNFKAITEKLISLGGKVPNDREVLESMQGVGRKTANVVLSELFDVPCIAVDTHVSRVSKRLKIAEYNDDVNIIENKLMKKFDKKYWNKLHLQLVLFGRYRCKAKNPICNSCKFYNNCRKIEEEKNGN